MGIFLLLWVDAAVGESVLGLLIVCYVLYSIADMKLPELNSRWHTIGTGSACLHASILALGMQTMPGSTHQSAIQTRLGACVTLSAHPFSIRENPGFAD